MKLLSNVRDIYISLRCGQYLNFSSLYCIEVVYANQNRGDGD